MPEPSGLRIDGLALAALVIVAFLILQSLFDGDDGGTLTAAVEEIVATDSVTLADEGSALSAPESAEPVELDAPPLPITVADPLAIAYPYDDYWLTQGPHGYSYGHMAIDLAAGKGSPVKSPIHGEISGDYVDQYGNTTLIIENDAYVITILHGNYSVKVGQKVALGEVVGTEGNNGYVTDMQGRSCRNRDCGYHSHLNVYSKGSQTNVNPLTVLQ